MPDLTVDADRLATSWRVTTGVFKSTSCDIVEGCVGGAGKRTLLRFAVATPNIGAADLYLGNPVGNPLFVYSSCHKHTTRQWLDVTGISQGTYILEVIVNPNGVRGDLVNGLAESDYTNNSARTTITIN